MRTLALAAVAAVTALTLAACGGPPGPHQDVTGIFIRVGGPAPGSPVPLPGTVTARDKAGGQFTATAGSNGRFLLSLPPGTYRLTGHSPQVAGGLCTAPRPVHVTAGKPVRHVQVICSIS